MTDPACDRAAASGMVSEKRVPWPGELSQAIDRGFRVVIVEDALCSSSDAGHEADDDLSYPHAGADRINQFERAFRFMERSLESSTRRS